jgi:hypothetical protein
MDVFVEGLAMLLVPRKGVGAGSSYGEDDNVPAFVRAEVLEQLAALVAGPQRRIPGAASPPANRRTAVGVPAAMSATSGRLRTAVASRHGPPRGSAPRRDGPSPRTARDLALAAEAGLPPVRFRSAPLLSKATRSRFDASDNGVIYGSGQSAAGRGDGPFVATRRF